ncbi:MAG: hypothetical protein GXP25_12550 [Planctomycetes bacterium]|nr:hypothetical protein [Planctomycetota bacterium]
MKKAWCVAYFVIAIVSTSCLTAQDKKADERTITFAKGQWDASEWTPIRLIEHTSTATFTQKPDCIGTNSFTKEERKKRLDNVLLMIDSKTTEGEFEVTFRIGPEHGTAPGVFLSPVVKDGVLQTTICAFVADYTMAVWLAKADPEAGKTNYTHLVRTATWQNPSKKHVLRCRYSKKRKLVALQLDQGDVLVLRFPEYELNSRIGIWGCHGTSDFYRITIRKEGTLPWKGVAPGKGE